ncbi:hypothetical protein [Ekhidna sp.]
MNTQELVLKYFNSWQEPADFDETAACLHDQVAVDLGFFKSNHKAEFIGMMSMNPSPWKDMDLLFSKYIGDFACIIYEGIDTQNNAKMRVSECLEVQDNLIVSVSSVITQLPS